MSLDDLIVASREHGNTATAADRARVRAKLAERLRAEPAPASRRRKRWTTAVLLAAAVLAVGTASALEARRALRPDVSTPQHATDSQPLPERHVAHAERAIEPVAIAPPPAASSAPAPPLATAAKDARTPAAPSVAPSSTALADEMALVQQARAALRRGAAAEALAALDRHDAEHRRGTFAQESAALRVLALCEAGRVGEARARGEAFLRAFPRSPLAVRIRASCAAPHGPSP